LSLLQPKPVETKTVGLCTALHILVGQATYTCVCKRKKFKGKKGAIVHEWWTVA
jgi:hypothetical protein